MLREDLSAGLDCQQRQEGVGQKREEEGQTSSVDSASLKMKTKGRRDWFWRWLGASCDDG